MTWPGLEKSKIKFLLGLSFYFFTMNAMPIGRGSGNDTKRSFHGVNMFEYLYV